MLGVDGIGESDCEALREGWLSQPTSAATSLAYVVAGIILFLRLPKHERFRAGGLYALLLALIGAGSVVYHGPQWPGSRIMHDAPIPALLVLIAVVVLWRWRKGQVILPGWSKPRKWAVLVIFVAAPVAYGLGRTGSPVCEPGEVVQLHGLWHMLTAAGFVVVGEILFRPNGTVAVPDSNPTPGARV